MELEFMQPCASVTFLACEDYLKHAVLKQVQGYNPPYSIPSYS
jgi:hypothetical protein